MRFNFQKMAFGLRVAIPTLLIIMGLVLLSLPYMRAMIEHWANFDLSGRSRLIASTVSEATVESLRVQNESKATRFLNRLRGDERLYAVGFCGLDGALLNASERFFKDFNCPKIENDTPASEIINTLDLPSGMSLHVAAIPLELSVPSLEGDAELTRPVGWLVLMHDRAFIASRGAETTSYILIWLFFGGALIAAITLFIAELTRQNWIKNLRIGIKNLHNGEPSAQNLSPVFEDIRDLIRQLESERRIWDADALQQIMRYDLSGEEVFVVSNREPYVHHLEADGSLRMETPAGGVATALEPVVSACNGTWVAWGSGSGDKKASAKNGTVRLPPEDPKFTLQRVWLDDEERERYYNGFSNEGIYPLCLLTHTRPVFRTEDWEMYKQVNQKFCDTIVARTKTETPVILVQDYHFALLPKMLKEALPDATIVTFWHIPWPNAEQFSICPWRTEILEGLLGSHIIGFHTGHHARNFLDTVQACLEARVDFVSNGVVYGGHNVQVKSYPISIAWPQVNENSNSLERASMRQTVMRECNIPSGITKLGLGVDRLDYAKGLVERFQSVERFLERNKEMAGTFCFMQIVSPSRTTVDVYRQYAEKVRNECRRINEKFKPVAGHDVICLREAHHDKAALDRYYRATDFCFVSSLHDGMNLVAKEFVAVRESDDGVLILSRFTGAAAGMPDAILVNPYHIDECAAAIHAAVTMPLLNQKRRMQAMRRHVREHNIFRWAGKMLLDASDVRRLDGQRFRNLVSLGRAKKAREA